MTQKWRQCLKNGVFFVLFFVLMTAGILGCSSAPIAGQPIKDPPYSVFYSDYDEVWRAIQLAIRKYPVRLNNIESGILETDYIKGDQLFSDPVPDHQKPGMRYKITIRAIKGRENKKSAVKVVVTKTVEIQHDFFTGYQPVPSYGLEEEVILYRIKRNLTLDKILSKAAGQSQN